MSVKRLDILNALISRLATITGAPNYYTDFGGRVFLARQDAISTTELPCLNVRRSRNRFTGELTARTASSDQALAVEIMILVDPGATPHDVLEKAIADVYKAIGFDLDAGTSWLKPHGADAVEEGDEIVIVKTSEDGSPLDRLEGGALVNITVFYRTAKWRES
jgi:hypothetical protein